ncbi:MAG: hypothetical protein GTO51_11000 [Candidatus Latescibacteria bacterium]|nr:hypothetical protein [Candidatus Latescibacterota bacterium]NIM66490.1 hypothetical protein [Candidatus Latescibacterota bacterium]NIO02970.1 hypothetical protein [Candidatus Latescibacterota bacterium]NIO30105.1 hypothetical protein [Candidatus Latescibacterota bacterium]NIO57724.1 hypothetical protein [Candidatus Latescibacterota bacterium]
MMKKLILPLILVLFSCSSVKHAIIKDIPIEKQEALIKKYKNKKAWTRIILEDLSQHGIVQRDTKVEIIDLDFHMNGSVTVKGPKRKKIVHGLEVERPLTVEKIESRLADIFWFKDPMLRQVEYIRKWGKKTGRAIRNHEVFIGMDAEAALESWGIPTEIKSYEIGGHKEEQWIYKVGNRSKYIYVVNDKITRWED